MALIKFALRRNLIYPLQLLLYTFARVVLTWILGHSFEFSASLFFSPLMFLGECSGGAIFYFYHKKFIKKKDEGKESYFMSIKLLRNTEDDDDYFIPLDSNIKILFLIFANAIFDLSEYPILTSLMPKYYKHLSNSFTTRYTGFSTLLTLFFYVYALKLPIYKHHKFSIIIIAICLIIMIIIEYIYHEKNIYFSYKQLTESFIFMVVVETFISLNDSVEKYLFEYDYMNPFLVLMYEGLFGFILSLIYVGASGSFGDVGKVYDKCSGGKFALFLFLLFIYVILSAGKNLFRVVTNKIYSPMTKTLTDYLFNPIYLIYYNSLQDDFKSGGKTNTPYFVLNLILAIIISFFGCVYNEFIILFSFGLGNETHDQISQRSLTNISEELMNISDDEDSHDSSDDNSSSK